MLLEEIDIYRQLQEHLDQLPGGFPPSKSGAEIRILKHLFTPEEAKIATKLQFSWDLTQLESLEKIYERVKPLGYTKDELEKLLENMVKKETIMVHVKGDKKSYGSAMFIIGIFDPVNRAFASPLRSKAIIVTIVSKIRGPQNNRSVAHAF